MTAHKNISYRLDYRYRQHIHLSLLEWLHYKIILAGSLRAIKYKVSDVRSVYLTL